MKNKNNKKQKRSFLAILLCFALLITGLFAFLTAHDSKINRFNLGDINVVVREPDWVDDNNVSHSGWYSNTADVNGNYPVLHDSNSNGIPDFAELIVPGQAIDKAPYAENTGTLDSWTYLMIGIPTALENNNGLVVINEQQRQQQITVRAFSVQEQYVENNENLQTVWTQFVNNNPAVYGTGVFENINGVNTVPAARSELFGISDINTVNFTFIPYSNEFNYFPCSDGYNYYVYGYNTKLAAGASTSRIFTSVYLKDNVVVENLSHGTATLSVTITQNNENTVRTFLINSGTVLTPSSFIDALVTYGYARSSIDSVGYSETPESVDTWVSNTVTGETYYCTATIL